MESVNTDGIERRVKSRYANKIHTVTDAELEKVADLVRNVSLRDKVVAVSAF